MCQIHVVKNLLHWFAKFDIRRFIIIRSCIQRILCTQYSGYNNIHDTVYNYTVDIYKVSDPC